MTYTTPVVSSTRDLVIQVPVKPIAFWKRVTIELICLLAMTEQRQPHMKEVPVPEILMVSRNVKIRYL